ncbi:hypothetical protein [Amycolatopsis sp. cmx-4-54]
MTRLDEPGSSTADRSLGGGVAMAKDAAVRAARTENSVLRSSTSPASVRR